MFPVVRIDGLTKDFPAGSWRRRPHRALDRLSLQIPAGGIFGLLGPNGAGKSTTLKLLLNLLRPTAGQVDVLGRPPGDLDVRRSLGFLPEEPAFYDYLTGEELLNYVAGLFGLGGGERRRRISEVLDRVGIGAERARPLRQYSKGTLQRVGLAQALVNDPELLILDDPMAGLDPVGRRLVRDILLDVGNSGRTVIFSSHILADAESLCRHVAILSHGRLVASGAVPDLIGQGAVGSEIVVSGVTPGTLERLSLPVQRLTRISDGRVALDVQPGIRAETVVATLAAAGATLVSVTPLGSTLEDVFMRALGAPHASTDPPAPLPGESSPAIVISRASAGGAASRIGLVAWHTFKESVRDRVLYAIAAFALIVLAAALILGQLSAGQAVKVAKDLGLATMELAGALMSMLIGVGLVAREIDRRSILSLLAKPLRRWEFIAGKYAGLVLTITVNVVGMAVALYVVLAVLDWRASDVERRAWETAALDPRLTLAILMIAAELALLTAVALFFSTFSSHVVSSVVCTVGVFAAGLLSADLRTSGSLVDVSPWLPSVVSAIGWIVPAFSAFDIKSQVVHGLPLPDGFVALTLAYAGLYVLALLAAAIAAFSRKEFT